MSYGIGAALVLALGMAVVAGYIILCILYPWFWIVALLPVLYMAGTFVEAFFSLR